MSGINRTVWVLAAVTIAAIACGGDDPPTQPSGNSCATITIANNAVSPNAVTVSPGCQVTFTNNDSRNHEMASDPHPEHSDCRELNSLGVLQPGQSRQTGNLNTARTCGFHDHQNDQIQALRGTITIR